MLHRIILGLILMNGYLSAMSEPGVWDKYGNYLGPAVPPSQMVVHVPMPVPMVQFVPVYTPGNHMMMPMFANHMMFPMGYAQQPMQQFIPPVFPQEAQGSDQWAAAQSAMQEPEVLPIAPAPLEDNPPKPGQWRVVSEVPVHPATDNNNDDDDEQVAAITKGMEITALADEKKSDDAASDGLVASAQPSKCWADQEDDDSAPTLMPGWQRYAVQEQPSAPAATQSASSADMNVTKESSPVVAESKNRSVQKTAHQPESASVVIPQGIPLDERLTAAMNTPKNMHALLKLMQKKVGWLVESCPQARVSGECRQLAENIKQKLMKARPVCQHATTFLDYADRCLRQAKKENQRDAKKGFIDLAQQLIAVAEAGNITDVQKVRIKNQMSRINQPKKTVVDQTAMSEEIFYEGYTIAPAATVVRSDGRVLCAVQDDTKNDNKKIPSLDAAFKKKNIEKKQAAPVASTATVDTPPVVSAPSPHEVTPIAPQQPVTQDEKVRAILAKDIWNKDSIKFLQKAVEKDGEIADAELKTQVLFKLAMHYANARGDNKSAQFAQQLGLAKKYMSAAFERGVKDAGYHLIEILYEQADMPHMKTLCDQVCSDDTTAQRGKEFVSAYRALALLAEDAQYEKALEIFKSIEQIHSWNNSMQDFANMLPESFYVAMREQLAGWQAKVSAPEGVADTSAQISRKAMRDWLYVMGRMHLEASHPKAAGHDYEAIEWVRAAADAKHPLACIYIASSSKMSCFSRSRCIDYLISACKNDELLSNADHIQMTRMYEHHGMQGDFKALFLVLMACHTYKQKNSSETLLDTLLTKLRDKFPIMNVEGDFDACYEKADKEGLITELSKRVDTDWVSRALLSVLQITRANTVMSRSADEVVKLRAAVSAAIGRIESDVESHPEIKPIIAAGYRRLALEAIMETDPREGAEELFNKAIALGDVFAKAYSAARALTRHKLGEPVKKEQLESIKVLEKLIEENSDQRLYAYQTLVQYYVTHQEWEKAAECIKQGKAWVHFTHQDPATFKADEEKVKTAQQKKRKDIRNRVREKMKSSRSGEVRSDGVYGRSTR